MNRDHIKSVFAEYTAHFDTSNIKIKLKVDHTYRVAEISDRIARSLTTDEADIDLAWLLGMLHDIGRFEQLTRYGTFTDAHSIDHAEFGADLLFKEGLFERFCAVPSDDNDFLVPDASVRSDISDTPDVADVSDASNLLQVHSDPVSEWVKERSMIETAIRLHNKYRLPEDLDDRTKMFSQILRDADKIDILRVQADIPFDEIHPGSIEDLYTSEVRDIFMDYVMQHICASRDVVGERTAAESYMSHCMLTFELVYDESRRIVAEQGYLAQLLTFQSRNARTQECFHILIQELEKAVPNLHVPSQV